MVTTNKVNLDGVKHVFNVGATKFYSAEAIMPVLGLGSSAAVIAAAKKAGVTQRERDLKLRWLFTANEIEKLAARPGRGRPVDSGHPNGPRKAKVNATSSEGSATEQNTDAADIASSEAMNISVDASCTVS